MNMRRLCSLNELRDRGARGFELSLPDGTKASFIVVRDGDAVYVYHNRCPHTGINLEWQPDQFLDPDGAFLQCATHGALFRPEDGYCVRGPCAGDRLQAVPAAVIDGEVAIRA